MSFPEAYFRAGVGAVLLNRDGRVLAFERSDVAGAWQLPQGGLEASEEPFRAACREVEEETGIRASDVKLVDAYPEPLVYELPSTMQSRKTGRGQVQYWFLFRFTGLEESIDLKIGGEFRKWKWCAFQDLLNRVADFRKPVYRKLADRFAPHLDHSLSGIDD
jgi:putative (di)nucleoside polyphosphate hydrolase